MNRMQKRLYWVLGFALVLVLLRAQEAGAASADVTIFTRAEDIHVGDTFYVMVSVVSEMPVSDVEFTVPIDSKKLKFTTGGDVAAATKSKVTITDIGSDTAETTKIYALGFEAKKKGDFVFHIESPFAVYAYDAVSDSRVQLSVSSNELPVTILKKGAKSPSPKPSAGAEASAPPEGFVQPDASAGPGSSAGTQSPEVQTPSAGSGMSGEQGAPDAPGISGTPEEGSVPGFSAGPEKAVAPEESAGPKTSLSPSPFSAEESAHGGSTLTNFLIGIIVIIIIGALAAAGYFIVKIMF